MKSISKKLLKQTHYKNKRLLLQETSKQEFFKVTSESPHGHGFFEEKECGHKGRALRHAGASDRYFERLLAWEVSTLKDRRNLF